MKKQFFILPILALFLLACSKDDPIEASKNVSKVSENDKYVFVGGTITPHICTTEPCPEYPLDLADFYGQQYRFDFLEDRVLDQIWTFAGNNANGFFPRYHGGYTDTLRLAFETTPDFGRSQLLFDQNQTTVLGGIDNTDGSFTVKDNSMWLKVVLHDLSVNTSYNFNLEFRKK